MNGLSDKEFIKEHTRIMIEDYKYLGIECLVIWDFELFENKERVKNTIQKFTNNYEKVEQKYI